MNDNSYLGWPKCFRVEIIFFLSQRTFKSTMNLFFIYTNSWQCRRYEENQQQPLRFYFILLKKKKKKQINDFFSLLGGNQFLATMMTFCLLTKHSYRIVSVNEHSMRPWKRQTHLQHSSSAYSNYLLWNCIRVFYNKEKEKSRLIIYRLDWFLIRYPRIRQFTSWVDYYITFTCHFLSINNRRPTVKYHQQQWRANDFNILKYTNKKLINSFSRLICFRGPFFIINAVVVAVAVQT